MDEDSIAVGKPVPVEGLSRRDHPAFIARAFQYEQPERAGIATIPESGKVVTVGGVVEIEGNDKPACVAESVVRVFP